MENYDKTKIRKLISWGGEHFVYNYGTDQVIKFSSLYFLLGLRKAKLKATEDYKICQEFFGQYILETKLVLSPCGKCLAHIQPKIAGHFLELKDLEEESIRKQFKEIMQDYNAMIKAGKKEIDFIGRMGLLKKQLSNIFVTQENKLKIIDATLLSADGVIVLRLYVRFLRKIVLAIQNRTLKAFFQKIDRLN